MRSRPWTVLGLLLTLVASPSGCRDQGPADTASAPVAALRINVRDNKGFLFAFFDRNAQMRTVERISDVQAEARKAVMVTSLSGGLPQDRIYVADLSSKGKNGRYRVWIEQRGTWLDRVMPRASVARLSEDVAQKPRARKARRNKRRKRGSAGTTTQASATNAKETNAKEMPKVVMFSTSWCPSCKVARQYFTQKGVRYVDLNVEQNKAAAQKMVEIQQARGMKVGAVPLIIIGNQVYQGFSQMQIEAGLAKLEGPKSAG